MADCPYLEYESNNYIFTSSDKYICRVTGTKMSTDDYKAKNVCKCDYGENYKSCPAYQSK